jgi:hypothetical protein
MQHGNPGVAIQRVQLVRREEVENAYLFFRDNSSGNLYIMGVMSAGSSQTPYYWKNETLTALPISSGRASRMKCNKQGG